MSVVLRSIYLIPFSTIYSTCARYMMALMFIILSRILAHTYVVPPIIATKQKLPSRTL